MHRAIRSAAVLRQATRQFSSTRCWCQASSESTEPNASTSAPLASTSAPLPAYSLPIDAFTGGTTYDHTPPPTQTGRRPAARSRQKQHLTNSEAQAFADLIGEMLPRSTGKEDTTESGYATGSMFDLAAPQHQQGLGGGHVVDAQKQVQEALMRKAGHKSGVQAGKHKWERKARDQLTDQESIELDRLKEELMGLRTDREVLLWGMRNVFGFKEGSGDVFPDPKRLAAFPVTHSPDAPSSSLATVGPSSRLYPELLLVLFLVLRDTHRSPYAALSIFSLASSNAFSFINGCTPALYTEVLRTRWAQGDVDSVLSVLEEMRASGLTIDDKGRELVRAIGDAVRIDGDRAELRVEHLVSEGKLDAELSGMEKEREVERRKFFGEKQRSAWARMEQIVEEVNEELERVRREKEDERRREEYAPLATDYAAGFDLPERTDVAGGRGDWAGSFGRRDERAEDGDYFQPFSPPPRRTLSPYDEPVPSSRRFTPRSSDAGESRASSRASAREFGSPGERNRDEGGRAPFGDRRTRRKPSLRKERGEEQPALWWQK
ncbi:hypothetical protein JCM6882_005447 [Rhodosporidiobolus microsporus]